MQNTDPGARLRESVAEAIRVECARRRISGAELARSIGISPAYLSRRMRGDAAFDTDDLARIADALDLALADFLPAAERAA